jgi:DNA-binding beta-propeller fold protein YncE
MTSNIARDRVQAAVCAASVLVTFSGALAHGQSLEFGPPFVVRGAFRTPVGLAVDPTGTRVYVADAGDHRVRVTLIAGIEATPTWNEFGFVANRAAPEALNEPQGIAIDAAGHAYVIDTANGEVQLYRHAPGGSTGVYTLDATFASSNRHTVDGVDMRFPRDIAVGPDGRIYLLDSGNDRVLVADGPADTSWEVFRANSSWGNPYGIDVGPDNAVYIADTDNHRIVKILAGTERTFGTFGHGNRQFRYPRDVAVESASGRLFVADTNNHRVSILQADGSHYRNLGAAPLYGALQKIEVDSAGRVFVLDSNLTALIAYLGPDATAPFDAYLRDYVGDVGTQPSNSAFVSSSPDMLLRYHVDIDPALAATTRLEVFAFEQPRFAENNHVYVAIHNRGTQAMTGATVRLYWGDPATPLAFPADWKTDGFYHSFVSSTINDPGNSIFVPSVPGRSTVGGVAVDGTVVVGPLVWRPPAPESTSAGDGRVQLFARLIHLDDPSEAAGGLDQVTLNNNIAMRPTVVTRGPFPVGDQDTLVVRVNFPDVPGSASEATLQTRIDEVDEWVQRVTYDLTTLKPLFLGPVTLDNPRTFYADPTRNLLIELTTEVLTKLLAAQPALLDGPTADPADDIDRVILVVNDTAFTIDWATTGLWPYDLAGARRRLSTSVQGPANSTAQYAHGLSHQFGLRDLYIHENVDADPVLTDAAARWDNMARPFEGAHPLVWSKQLATWLTSSGGRISYIQRPPRGTPPRLGQPAIPLNYQSILQSGQFGAIAVGLTEGVTTFSEETHFYWIEARKPGLGGDTVPEKGVLVYYAHLQIPQGEAPVVVRDGTASTTTRDDAALGVSETLEPAGTGIRVTVDSEVASDGGFMVRVDYQPPPTGYDVRIRVGDPAWTSPDIWVDNQRDGGGYHAYDAMQHTSSGRVEEQPIADEDNRIYARVHNSGPAAAFDVEVVFTMSEPYHTVGGEGDFDFRALRVIPVIPPGEFRDVFFTWRPAGVNDPHTCVRVELRRLVDDTNPHNHEAQQNLRVAESRTSSPYTEAELRFTVTNPGKQPMLVYFQAEGVPRPWTKTFAADKKLLTPAERFVTTLTVKPHDDATVCTDHEIYVTGWTPRGDTLVRLGGTTLGVGLRNNTIVQMSAQAGSCSRTVMSRMLAVKGTAVVDTPGDPIGISTLRTNVGCAMIVTTGCTVPPRPNETIYIKYADPAGNPVWRSVETDAMGCFEDSYTVIEGGSWQATGYYPGNSCSASAGLTVGIVVPIPETGDQDGDARPNTKEPDGDADADGFPNHLDPDSDNDRVLDGREPDGDHDKDGLDNSVDPDSDNDGVIDGQDPTPYGPGSGTSARPDVGFFVGYLNLDRDLAVDDTWVFGMRVSKDLTPQWSVEAEVATGTSVDSAGFSGRLWQFNAHALYNSRPRGAIGWRVFALGGAGLLRFQGFASSASATTFNFGAGVKAPIRPRVELRGDLKMLVGSSTYGSGVTGNVELTIGLTFKL